MEQILKDPENWRKNFKKMLILHTIFIISTLIYSLTIEEFLIHSFSMCASLPLALVSKIAL